jgi:RNA polymerase sigma-B factor
MDPGAPKATTMRSYSSTDTVVTGSGIAEYTDQELFRAMRTAGLVEKRRMQDLLVRRHSGLVRWLAAQYANKAVDADELRQVGYLGLVLAIQRFDVDRGHDFTTFARPTVQGEIRRYFRDKRRWIRLPRRLQEAKATLRESNELMTHQLGREPTVEELALHAALPTDLVSEALAADDTFSPTSLDAPVNADGEESFTVADTIGVEDERINFFIDCDSVRPLIAGLPQRERMMLHMRFYEDKTQTEIGAELGISQMHVSRLLSRTLDSLREQLVND